MSEWRLLDPQADPSGSSKKWSLLAEFSHLSDLVAQLGPSCYCLEEVLLLTAVARPRNQISLLEQTGRSSRTAFLCLRPGPEYQREAVSD